MKTIFQEQEKVFPLIRRDNVIVESFPDDSVVKNLPANEGNIGDPSSIPGSGRFSEEGNGSPLQCSCLKNPMDRAAWQATVFGVCQELDMTEQLSTQQCHSQATDRWKVFTVVLNRSRFLENLTRDFQEIAQKTSKLLSFLSELSPGDLPIIFSSIMRSETSSFFSAHDSHCLRVPSPVRMCVDQLRAVFLELVCFFCFPFCYLHQNLFILYLNPTCPRLC